MPASLPAPDAGVAGLVQKENRQPVALEGVHVAAHVTGPCARVVVRQRYRNRETVPLELVYVFPLDEGAAVCGFEAIVDGTRFVGQVKEREQAFIDYDDAMAAGHGAYLLDEERADVFQASLGNVRPGADVDLAITYVTQLAAEGPALRFTLPTTVSPRYAPAEDRGGVGPTPAEVLNPPTQLEVPYRLTFEMDVEMPGDVSRVESPTHPITVDRQGRRAAVRLTQRDVAMDRDLVIVIDAGGLDAPLAIVERTATGFAAAATLVPRFAASQAVADVVFLVDRSGSMGGTSIAEVRNALTLCLGGLTSGCRFDIVAFGSTFESLFDGSVPYDEASLRTATAAIEAMDADLGGTEILPALEHVLGRPRVEGLARQVVLLTDGEVTNTDAVIALARQHAGHARIFTFGIGAGASAHLVRAVARATGGAAEFIAPGERIEAKVLRQFRRVLAPALTDVRVQWPAGVTAAPETSPAVFDGERLVVYGLSDTPPAGHVRLSGSLAGSSFTAEVALGEASSPPSPVLGPLAARARIRDLEEQPEYLVAKGSRQRRARTDRGGLEEIVRLAVAYQLVSRETSFVAIEQRETPTDVRAELRKVPIALTSGWGGLQARGAHVLGMMAGAPLASRASMDMEMLEAGVHFRSLMEDYRASPIAPLRESAIPPHVALVRLQRADGSWDFSRHFERIVGRGEPSRAWRDRLTGGDDVLRRRALATAMALAWLEHEAAGFTDEWAMAADKARAWLRGCGVSIDGGEAWEEFGRSLLA